MPYKDIDWTQEPKVMINGEKYWCSREITIKDHVFNNSNAEFKLKNVYPASYPTDRLTPFKLPKYSEAILYIGTQVVASGVVKLQSGGTEDPRRLKDLNLSIVFNKEWLVHKYMDFPIVNKDPEWVVDKVLGQLGNKKIVKGTIAFGNQDRIEVYNTKTKTAYDVLRTVEKHTQSILQLLPRDDGSLSVNFFDEQSIVNSNNGNKGVDFDAGSLDKAKALWNKYDVFDISWKDNNMKNKNFVRVESEAIVANKSQTQKIDLTQGQSSVSLLFPIGEIDKTNTFVTIDGKRRKLIVITADQQQAGKAYDIYYSVNDKTINLNKRLIGKNGIVSIDYKPLQRISFDFGDSNDQQQVAKNAGSGDGQLTRYEKHNDLTNTNDIAAHGKRYLEISLDEKVELTISSGESIWDLGEHTKYTSYSNDSLDGDYIVKEIQIKLNIDAKKGAFYNQFVYTLVKTKDLENDMNFEDPVTYRDNPLYGSEGIIVDTTTPIDQNVFVIASNVEFSCGVFVDNSLELGLEAALGDTVANLYPVVDMEGSA